MRAACIQYPVVFGDFEANARQVRALLAEGPAPDLVVLPELAFSGYDFVDRGECAAHAEPFGAGPAAALLTELAAAHGCTLIAGYAERAREGCYNAALCALPDGTLHNYRKVHLFNREREIFLPGDAAPPVIETPHGRVGLMICFDWFFPEVARSLALRGAQVLAHPSNLVLPWCQRAMFARCVENRVFAMTCNRIGTEERAGRALTFTGGSQILNPRGETLAAAPTDAAARLDAEFSPADADDKSIAGLNDLFRDRRPELCPGL